MKSLRSLALMLSSIIVSTLLLSSVLDPSRLESTSATGITSDLGITAILVIDIFETTPDTYETTNLLSTSSQPNCVITPVGADGAAWVPTGGGGATPTPGGPTPTPSNITPTASIWTSAFHPYDQPHGRMVYSLFEALARSKNGIEGTYSYNNRLYEMWSFGSERILLAQVDTTGYTTTRIATAIGDTVNNLYNSGIRRFIFNMSFVLLPCADFPTFSFKDFVGHTRGANPYEPICTEFLNEINGYQSQNCADLANKVDNTSITNASDRRVLYSILRNSVFDDLRTQVYTEKIQPALEQNLAGFYNGLSGSFFTNDPLYKLLTQAKLPTTPETFLPVEGLYLSVAASGNATSATPYAPARFKTVLSVSADYPQSGYCMQQLNPTPGVTPNGTIPANAGQVKEDGFFNCLAGTSFATPRVSFEMANFLNSQCPGVQNCGASIANACLGTPAPFTTGTLATPIISLGTWYKTPVGTGIYHPPLSYPITPSLTPIGTPTITPTIALTQYKSLNIGTASAYYCPAFFTNGFLAMNP